MTLLGQGYNFGGFVPSDGEFVPTGSPTAWFKADSLSLSNNDPVTTWSDSANSNNLSEATNPPTYKTGIQNSLPGVLGDGSNDSLTVTFGAPITQGNTILCVHKVVVAVSDRWLYSSTNGANRQDLVFIDNSGLKYMMNGGGANNIADAIDASTHISVCVYDGANSYFQLDSGAKDSLDVGAHSMDGITLFNRYDKAKAGNAYIFEYIVWNSALSDADIATNITGLNTKWGI